MSNRLNVIKSHFTFTPGPNPLDQCQNAKVNKSLLQEAYWSPFPEISRKFHAETLKSTLFNHHASLENSREEHLEITLRQLLYLYPKFVAEYDLKTSLNRALFGIALGEYDQTLCTRFLVCGVLFVETIDYLGTSKHASMITETLRLKHYGCFAMTELGHGSNVAGVETTATFDKTTRQFTINSPTPTAAKWWIGAAGHTADLAVVFAQLIVEGVNCGVHVFLVNIRDSNHNPIPGVVTGDCGMKAALNGIDNGFIIFNNYKVPYDTLLDRLSSISSEGKFKSSIKSKEKRFGIMLSGLTAGRCAILGNIETNFRNALTVAIRYGSVRKQFGGENENTIISYPVHKYRLMPYLAKCFAVRVGYQRFIKQYLDCKDVAKSEPEGMKTSELHALISALKPIVGRYAQDGIQECREACGGHGYSSYSGLNRVRTNNDVHLTWEGDNNVLIQQCSRFLLKYITAHFKGKHSESQLITFLHATKPEITVESIKCPKTLIQILEFRANQLAKKSVAKLQANASDDPSVSWKNTQVHYLNNLSWAFGELLLAKELLSFSESIKEKNVDTGIEIEKLFKLYVATILEKNFMGLSDTEYQIVQDSVVELCNEVAKSAVSIIDAIAIPDHILGSALGCSDGRVYERFTKEVESAKGVYDKASWGHLVKEMKTLIN